jgi:ATP-dependent Clp protease ATP-binding subunit ClpB
LKEKYESHHKVLIKDAAIIAAVELSTRYISDRFLAGQSHRPDRRGREQTAHGDQQSKPEELDEIDRRVMQLEIEREAIKRENDQGQLAET